MNILSKQLLAFSKTDARWLPLLSNASALLMEELRDINWAGFYLRESAECFHLIENDPDNKKVVTNRDSHSESDRLILGPFQGKTACIHIPIGKGVCGTAAIKNQTQRVANVHTFPGHIACDSATNSEIVIPVHDKKGQVIAVLDIDSTLPDRFSEKDQLILEEFVSVLEEELLFYYYK